MIAEEINTSYTFVMQQCLKYWFRRWREYGVTLAVEKEDFGHVEKKTVCCRLFVAVMEPWQPYSIRVAFNRMFEDKVGPRFYETQDKIVLLFRHRFFVLCVLLRLSIHNLEIDALQKKKRFSTYSWGDWRLMYPVDLPLGPAPYMDIVIGKSK